MQLFLRFSVTATDYQQCRTFPDESFSHHVYTFGTL
jgi:hypothetical protein